MLETIYTIPVNEAFDACAEEYAADHAKGTCPFCRLYDKLESDELDIILGASMMEPDIRIKTNELGFCHDHYNKMFVRKNRLQMALMLESHLDSVRESLDDNFLSSLTRSKGKGADSRLHKLEDTCYICGRIDYSLGKMIENAVYLWEADADRKENPFGAKISAQKYFCLPHYRAFVGIARNSLSNKHFTEFYKTVSETEKKYFDELRGDISWFCKKFDYRYENEDWGNSKDAVERAIAFLSGRTK